MLSQEATGYSELIAFIIFITIVLMQFVVILFLIFDNRKKRDEVHRLFLENQLLKKDSGFNSKQLEEIKLLLKK